MSEQQLSSAERQRLLLEIARSQGRVRVIEAATELHVTPETIRKDLNALQESGFIRRVHGGGVLVESLAFEPRLAARTEQIEQKRQIAKSAVSELPSNGVIFIESGSTTQLLAELIPADRSLVVITNSLPTAIQLSSRPNLTLVTLGGRVRSVTLGTVDGLAIRNLSEMNVDVAFLGTNALSIERGLTTPDIGEAEMKRAALSCARRRVLLADSSKLDQVSFFRYGDLNDIELLITDSAVSPELETALNQTIDEVRVAS
ncbi:MULTISPECIES: DeoR/GlpR family DNA-binding transcription regulator [Microbacterium]|uniref:DeoR/GlpR family DNA-binding transcription regulator n=1 Tax=Microbacterium TaxID=33882 RepID=UPI0020C08B32|nr:DeoR/GlpR family DNA-binding transcription regulator [Microbacterium aurugineum]MCK8475842.1 DeoR/GlpR family DNA-binding transcription regulator [Microbacterium aurugineum]